MKFTYRRQVGRTMLQAWVAMVACTALVYLLSFYTGTGHLIAQRFMIGLLLVCDAVLAVAIAAGGFWIVEVNSDALWFRSSPLRRPTMLFRADIREIRRTDRGLELVTQSRSIILPREVENIDDLFRRLNPVLGPPPKQIEQMPTP